MSRSRGRKRGRNRRSRAGIVSVLLLAVILTGTAVFALSRRFTLPWQTETQTFTPADQALENEGSSTGTGENDGAEAAEYAEELNKAKPQPSIGMETLPVVETEPEPEYRDEITLTFAGDVLLDPGYAIMANMLQRGGDITTCFDDGLMEIMTGSDIFMINNEFPYSDRGTPLPEKQFTFRAKPEYADKLTEIGVDIAALGNNHVNDYGQDAMMDTFDTLDGIGMPYVGAGRDLQEASRPYYLDIEGMRIAFVCATQIERLGNPDTVAATATSPGVLRCLAPEHFVEVIKEARENADFVVAYIHWGTESEANIDWLQQEQAPMYVEAGADLIIGDHPHVLQKIEVIEGVPVLYSMGNYLFNSSSLDTGLARVTVDTKEKSIKSLEFIPAKQSGCRTTMLDGAEKKRVIDYINSLSDEPVLDEQGYLIR